MTGLQAPTNVKRSTALKADDSEAVLSPSEVTAAITTKAWWQWGAAPYPLEVPHDLASRATPIWAPNTTLAPNTTCKNGKLPGGAAGACAAWPQFVLARKEFRLPSKSLKHAVAFVTAQQSEFCPPDQYVFTLEMMILC